MSYIGTGAITWADIERTGKALLPKPASAALSAYGFYRKHPWILPVGIAAVIGIPFALGYTLGKRRRGR